jgi:ribonuclease HI
MTTRLIAATDGSAIPNPGPCAWAWVLADAAGRPQRWEAGPLGRGTSNIGELTALAKLLEATDPAVPLEVRMDSEYARKAVTLWLDGWKRRGWQNAAGKPVANQELIRRIDGLLRDRDVVLVHVPAHRVDGDKLNALADELANTAARTQRPSHGPEQPG